MKDTTLKALHTVGTHYVCQNASGDFYLQTDNDPGENMTPAGAVALVGHPEETDPELNLRCEKICNEVMGFCGDPIPNVLRASFAWVVGNPAHSWFKLQLTNLWDDASDKQQYSFEVCQRFYESIEYLLFATDPFCDPVRDSRELFVAGYENNEDEQ